MQIRKTHAYKLGGFKKLTFNMFRKSAIRNLYGCTINDINYEYAKHLLINGIHPDTIADKLYDRISNTYFYDNIPTALMSAASAGSIKICKLLIEHGADVNKKVNGGTALTHAWWILQDYKGQKNNPNLDSQKIIKIEKTFDYLSNISAEPPLHYNISKISKNKSDIKRFKRYLRENSDDEEFCHTTLNLIEEAEEQIKILELEILTD